MLGVENINLDELLIYADISQIHKIIDQYQCECNRHSKTEMIQSLIYTVFSRDTLKASIYGLDEAELTYIQLLYLDARINYTLEDLLAKGKQAISLSKSLKKPRELVLLALKMGWIFQGVGKKHSLAYLVPHDFKQRVLLVLKDSLQQHLITIDNINYYREEKELLTLDLANFIKYVLDEEVLLTSDGNIYKRQQGAILGRMLIKEDPIKNLAWRFGYGRRYNEYPDRFSLIYDYAFYHKLIYEDERGYLIITSKGASWLKCFNKDEESYKLYQFWVRLYKNAIPYLQPVLRIIDLVAANNWVQVESLENLFFFWLDDHYYENKEQVFKERIIKILLHLGVIQLSYDNELAFLRITKAGHSWINGTI